MRLVINEGHWAIKDNSMIFGNIVWLCNENDAQLYHLVDDNHQDVKLEKPITDYIVYDDREQQDAPGDSSDHNKGTKKN